MRKSRWDGKMAQPLWNTAWQFHRVSDTEGVTGAPVGLGNSPPRSRKRMFTRKLVHKCSQKHYS